MEQQQWRDIAYCLTQLPYNIRCVRKIIEGFQYYKVQVQDDIVYDCFTQIISKARKTNAKKPEVHEELEEWAKKLERLNQGLSEEVPEGEEAEQSAVGEVDEGGDDQSK
jgi:condensin complex subunit 1